jgi:iron uptake system component EfeO
MTSPSASQSPQTPPANLMRLAVAGAALLVIAGGAAFFFASQHAQRNAAIPTNAVTVTIGAKSCDPNVLTVPAGAATFQIVNKSDRALEWEILDGVMVLEERENIAPGLTTMMSTKLAAGDYAITCGLLSNPRGTLHVTPAAAVAGGIAAPSLVSFVGPLAEYKVFLVLQSNALAQGVAVLADAIKGGDLTKARSLYANAVAPYRRIEPVAKRFADLDSAIDANAEYFEQREKDPAFTGLHRIEYGLFSQNSLDGLAPVADRLVADVATLQRRLHDLKLTPSLLADSPAKLVAAMADTEVPAGAENYAHTDLAGFDANLVGVGKMVSLLRPVASVAAPALSTEIDQQLAAANKALAGLKVGGSYPAYENVSAADRAALATKLQALAASLGKLDSALGLQ